MESEDNQKLPTAASSDPEMPGVAAPGVEPEGDQQAGPSLEIEPQKASEHLSQGDPEAELEHEPEVQPQPETAAEQKVIPEAEPVTVRETKEQPKQEEDMETSADPDLEEEMDEDEEESHGNSDDGLETQNKARHPITGRGVTLAMLMTDGLIEPGENVMSIEYLGQKFTGDLLPDGRIRGREQEKIFSSPSSWAIHCKKIVNPMKKSGCGWASVKYKGRKLDAYKSTWFNKQRMPANQEANGEVESDSEDGKQKLAENGRTNGGGDNNAAYNKKKISVKHSILGMRNPNHDQNTMVQCTNFITLGKIQPFNIAVTTNCLLLIDFHCHLVCSEVVGYLAGKWDPNTQELSVQQAFPMKCRHADKVNALLEEDEIRRGMERRGLSLVGWYHSHPENQPDPSLRDIEAQMQYQLELKGVGNSYHPCLALIVSPFESTYASEQQESQIRAFWVMPPPEHRPLEYGMPMDMVFTVSQDLFLSQDILTEMKALVDYYKTEPDFIHFLDSWSPSATYLDKLKTSLTRKLPKDQTDGRLLEFIHGLLSSGAT